MLSVVFSIVVLGWRAPDDGGSPTPPFSPLCLFVHVCKSSPRGLSLLHNRSHLTFIGLNTQPRGAKRTGRVFYIQIPISAKFRSPPTEDRGRREGDGTALGPLR